jgi:uncharacterized protein involved in exopolysaccharide biosynthesis
MQGSTSTPHFGDYIGIISRRKNHFLIPATVVAIVAAALAFLLPPVYRSTATVLVEEQEIPDDLVRSTVTSYAAERIERIGQEVLKRDNILAIAEKYNLFPDLRAVGMLQEIPAKVKANIHKELVSADVKDPHKGGKAEATIAFTISYDGDNPDVAQKVTTDLVDLFLGENIKVRMKSAEETTAFLGAESEALSREIAEIEQEIAAFKAEKADYLPENLNMYNQFVLRTEDEILQLTKSIDAQEQRKLELEGALTTIEPYQGMVSSTGQRIMSPQEQLKVKKTELIRLSALYSPDYPDVVKLKSEIASLERTLGKSGNNSRENFQDLELLKSQYAEKLEKYSKDHPDVVQLERAIAKLEKEQRSTAKSARRLQDDAPPENPAYISMQTQIRAVQSNINSMMGQRAGLKAKVEMYEQRLARIPEVEREYQKLMRDYQDVRDRYHDIKNKLLQAKIAQSLEEKGKGERFSLLEPPDFPDRPVKPNRIGIMLLGFVLAMGAGVAFAFIAEFFDNKIYRESQLADILGELPLVNIPLLAEDDIVVSRQQLKSLGKS